MLNSDKNSRPTMTEADPATPPAMKSCTALMSALVLAVVVAPSPRPLSLPLLVLDAVPPCRLFPVMREWWSDDGPLLTLTFVAGERVDFLSVLVFVKISDVC